MSAVVLDDSSCFDIDKINKQLDEVMPKIFGDKPKVVIDEAKFIENIYFHREKEENWGLEAKATRLGFKTPHDIGYLGSEVEMKVEITANHTKVLEIQGIDVSDKDIFI